MNETTLIKLSLARLYRLSGLRDRFKKQRDCLPMDKWLKISTDWTTAFFENIEADEEVRKQLAK